jgi:hypothetical protein
MVYRKTELILLIAQVFFVVFLIFPDDSPHIEELYQFSLGSGHNQLQMLIDAQGFAGVRSPNLVIGSSGPMINDALNNRIVSLANGFFVAGEYFDNSPKGKIRIFEDIFILESHDRALFKELNGIDFSGNDLFIFEYWRIENPVNDNFEEIEYFYLYNTLFLYDKNGRLWSIPEPGLDSDINWRKIKDSDETLEMIRDNPQRYSAIFLDEERNIFLEGRLLATNWDRYIAYWAEKTSNQSPPSDLAVQFPTNGYWNIRTNDFYDYIGNDNYGNTYWLRSKNSVLVFDQQGWITRIIQLNRRQLLNGSTLPVVSLTNGDIFYLEHEIVSSEDLNIKAFIIYQDWVDSSGINATVINSRLRVRSLPSLEGPMLGMLEIGEAVTILEKSDQELNIGELTDFWYRIDNGNGLVGWAYGAFLNIED